jgi:hypothetical protein
VSRPAALLIAAFAVAAAPLGCSRDGTPPAPPTTETSPVAHGGLADCLRANGVDNSAAGAAVLGPPSGVDPQTWEQAMRSCSSLAPGPPGP